MACSVCGGSGRNTRGGICRACGGTGSLGGTHAVDSMRRTLFAALVLTVAGVILVWLSMFLLAHG